ncbi:carbohydrate ABC transporter permease [Caldisalinibacter kiritimatiensis]|uniref:Maltose/maltodextrin ABC transporter, permease protein MalF n=1 Tax=Caldisalinibacter kiritimatiensis TaxID=1304284 RepID=R1CTB4_9FIRM|nr:sugar ABC transporter permease [Caldisalinibacter kiritimatiensis]EOD01886.1 Maltose/maltodextrin ABC transporter, permease protein MalF [Caldisalinibacter kiritimatiensis]
MSKKKKSLTLAQKEQRLAYKLLLPTLLILVIIAIYPLGQVFYTSLTDKTFASGDEGHNFVGFDNYKKLLSITIKELPPVLDEDGNQKIDPETNEPIYERPIRILPRKPVRYRELSQFGFFDKRYVIGATDPDFISAIGNTIVFTVVSVALETILGLIIALVVNSNFRGRGVMRTVMLVPWAVITVVSARMWEWMLQPNRIGFFNTLLERFGIGDGQLAFLTTKELQLPSIIAVDVWKTTPFMALLLLAGLQLIPDTLYEAADIDGASKVRQFFTITLPLLKPTIAVALVFRTLDALRVFDVFQVLLSNRRYSMASYNYFQLIGNRNMGLASAIGVIIFILIAIFAVSYIRLLGVDADE